MRKKSKKEIRENKIRLAKKITFSVDEFYCMCHYCEKYYPPDKLTLDHKISESNGGKTNIENIELACEKCNFLKGRIFYKTFKGLIKRIGLENYKNLIET